MARGAKIGFTAGMKAAVGSFDPHKYRLLSNTGLQGSILFSSQEDYDRFEAYLYILNAVEGPRASNFFLDGRTADLFSAPRGEKLVAIGAYSFTPKRFNILACERSPKGIAKFMQKLQTAYTMYFNLKYQRDGRLFHGPYVSEAATSERHLKYLLSFTHLHPAVLFDSTWDDAEDAELRMLAHNALQYRYSSVDEYVKKKFVITSPDFFPQSFRTANNPDALVRMWNDSRKMRESNRE